MKPFDFLASRRHARTLAFAIGCLVTSLVSPALDAQNATLPARGGGTTAPGQLNARRIEADRAFAEGSFARALGLYRALLDAPALADRELIEFRIAWSLWKTERPDEALAAARRGAREANWKARFHALEARVLVTAPKIGWRIGERVVRSDEYPEADPDVARGVVPQQIFLGESDRVMALNAFDEAKIAAQSERDLAARARFSGPIFPLSVIEEIDLNYDFAALLASGGFGALQEALEGRTGRDFDDIIDLSQRFARGWSAPKKALYLYHDTRRLAQLEGDKRDDFVRSLLAEGLFLRGYHAQMRHWSQVLPPTPHPPMPGRPMAPRRPIAPEPAFEEQSENFERMDTDEPLDPIAARRPQGVHKGVPHLDMPLDPIAARRPYPFDDARPEVVWRRIVQERPRSSYAPRALLEIAVEFEARSDPPSAASAWRELITRYSSHPLAANARAALARIEAAELRFEPLGTPRTDTRPRLRVISRNMASVRFEAFTVPLETLLVAGDSARDWGDPARWGDLSAARSRWGAPVASWSLGTGDIGDHRTRTNEIDAPLSRRGAFLIVASGAGASARPTSPAQTPRFAQVLVLSNLALVQSVDREGVRAFVADARTGAQVIGANVAVLESWNWNPRRTRLHRGQSDDRGLFVARRAGDNGSSFRSLAWRGDDYALTGAQGSWFAIEERAETRVWATTDRPLYRPGQSVNWRAVIQSRAAGQNSAWNPLSERRVRVIIADPRGEQVFADEFVSSQWGSISGTFEVPASAPLGVFSLRVEAARRDRAAAPTATTKRLLPSQTTPEEVEDMAVESLAVKDVDLSGFGGGTQFRVEEYKRPEFEALVQVPERAARPGEAIEARVEARYFWGGAVKNARVSFRVRRAFWTPRFGPSFVAMPLAEGSSRTSWPGRPPWAPDSGAIVSEGEVTTGDDGRALIRFEPSPLASLSPEGEPDNRLQTLYVIEVEVTDASRRVVEGRGSVRVADQPFFAALRATQGFVQTGERARFDLLLRDANDRPVASNGVLRVVRLLPDRIENGRRVPVEAPIHSEPVEVPASGLLTWDWRAPSAGRFRVEFEARGAWGEPVRARAEQWVVPVSQAMPRARLDGLTVRFESHELEEGATARAAIISEVPDATVLWLRDDGTRIIEQRLIRLQGHAALVEFEIGAHEVPNFFVQAVAVHDFAVHRAIAEIQVPPTRRLVRLEIEPAKTTPTATAPTATAPTATVGDGTVVDGTNGAPSFEPGERVAWTIRARDWRGEPVRSEVSLGLIDASLLAIQGSYTLDPGAHFYSERRSRALGFSTHLEGRLPGRAETPRQPPIRESPLETLELGELRLPPDGGGFWPSPWRGRPEMARSAAAPALLGSGEVLEQAASADTLSADRSGAGAPPLDEAGSEIMGPAPRENFAETAFWTPAVVTENGQARLETVLPDSLTRWLAQAHAFDLQGRVGAAQSTIESSKELMVRLQTPRFLVERDEVTVSALVDNASSDSRRVRVTLSLDPLLQNHGEGAPLAREVEVGARSQSRIEWRLRATTSGLTRMSVTAQTLAQTLAPDQPMAAASDAMSLQVPVLVHGAPVYGGGAGRIEGEARQELRFDFPASRRAMASRLDVVFNPSLAATMLDALPYLAEFPYGCVEQTMSRFLPAALSARVLRENGIDPGDLARRARAYEAESRALSPLERVQHSGYSFARGLPHARDLEAMAARSWGRRHGANPVFDPARLDAMVREGVMRLAAMQRGDGGWGWFPGAPASDPYMSAHVVYGLAQARAAGIEVPARLLERGRAFLDSELARGGDIHTRTAIAHALAHSGSLSARARQIASRELFESRDRLSPLGQAMLALTLWEGGDRDQARVLVRNLENTVVIDAQNATARFRTAPSYWHWWNNDTETVAFALRAFARIEPGHALVPAFTKWLTLRARGGHWESTKATAEIVYSLAEIVRGTRELDVDYTLRVELNGRLARTFRVTRDNALWFDNRFLTGDLFLEDGTNVVVLTGSGRGGLYWNASTEFFATDSPLPASGHELRINRRFWKLTRTSEATTAEVTAQPSPPGTDVPPGVPPMAAPARIHPPFPIPVPVEPAAPEYRRAELVDGATVGAGDLIEVELVIDASNDYSYLVFEDMKAAGFEPVEALSGYGFESGLGFYLERRDDKMAFFVDRLPQGARVLRYRVRAITPGRFHALPVNGYAMYAPEVRATSAEHRVGIDQ